MKNDEQSNISADIKFPLPNGMDEQNLPLDLKQRKLAIFKQAQRAIEKAEDLGGWIIEALGEILLESDLCVKKENRIEVYPETIIILFGLAAGNVAATLRSSDMFRGDPDFAKSVDKANRQNLLKMFQVGHAATVCKIQRLKEATSMTGKTDSKGKGGKLLQFPGKRT
jgi:hypothetical protein